MFLHGAVTQKLRIDWNLRQATRGDFPLCFGLPTVPSTAPEAKQEEEEDHEQQQRVG